MARVHFEEEQRMASLSWVWMASIGVLVLPIALMTTSREISSEDLSMIFLTTALTFTPVVAILFYAKLQVKINEAGLAYKFFPANFKWQQIQRNSIESFEVSSKQGLLEKMEIGHRRNLISKTITMNISGIKFVRIKLSDGRKINIGTGNPEGFERALHKLTLADNS